MRYQALPDREETGFLHLIWVKIRKLSQKPGFLDYLWESETGFLHLIWVKIRKLSQKPGFLD